MPRSRSRLFSVFIMLIALFSISAMSISLYALWLGQKSFTVGALINLLIGVIRLVAIVGLMKWKKWGAYLLIGSFIPGIMAVLLGAKAATSVFYISITAIFITLFKREITAYT